MTRVLIVSLLVALAGCASTPFSADGLATALEAAAPVVKELSLTRAGDGNGPSLASPAPVSIIVIFPNVARGIWPLSAPHVGNESIVIVVPERRSHVVRHRRHPAPETP